ncbi:MAG: tetratricopeptide repeat protein [Treponema sp.]|nr:tetratricopeptide repeat protein [Treponema sp.]
MFSFPYERYIYGFYGEGGFRISPTLTISANGGYISYNSEGSENTLSGPFAGLTAGNYTASVLKSEKISQVRRMQTVQLPLTIDFSSDLLNFSIARNKLKSGMNRNLQFSAAIFEALRNSGLVNSGDKKTPYSQYKAISSGLISAMNNLANVYMLEKNYSAAESQFKQVLKPSPKIKQP